MHVDSVLPFLSGSVALWCFQLQLKLALTTVLTMLTDSVDRTGKKMWSLMQTWLYESQLLPNRLTRLQLQYEKKQNL